MRRSSIDIAVWLMRVAVVGGLAVLASVGPALAGKGAEAAIIDALADTGTPFERARCSTRGVEWWNCCLQPLRSRIS
jgi:hypothetical protein